MTHSTIPSASVPPVHGRPRTHMHEGVRAGALGATVAWLWLFLSDVLHGTPLHLVTMFGRGFLGIGGVASEPRWEAVLAFTIVHFAYWCLLGTIAMTFVHIATDNPSVLSLAATLFILFQFLFVGVTAILARSGLGVFAWPSVLLGNLAGCVATWWYIARRHPELRTEERHMNDAG